MAVRPATAADIPLLRSLMAAVANPPHYPADEGVEAAFVTSPTEFGYVDDVKLSWCSVAVMPERREMTVRWLLPRREFDTGHVQQIAPLLARAIQAAIAAYPKSELEDWVIWAEFQDGRDALGVTDGGLALCQRWQLVFRKGAQRATVARSPIDPSRWRISWTVGPVKLVARTL